MSPLTAIEFGCLLGHECCFASLIWGCALFQESDKVFAAVFCGISFLTPSHAERYTSGDVKGSSARGKRSVSPRLLETCEKGNVPIGR